VPSAARAVRVAWSWTDEAENVGHLPAYNTPSRVNAAKVCASRTQAYIQKAWAAARANTSSNLYHNTPQPLGGRITSNDNDNSWALFAPWGGSADFAAGEKKPVQGTDPGFVLATARDLATAAGTVRAACVYVRPSTIAGDNFRISARPDFSACGGREAEL